MADIFHTTCYAHFSDVFGKCLREAFNTGQDIRGDYFSFRPLGPVSNTYKVSATHPARILGIREDVRVIQLFTLRLDPRLASPLDCARTA